MANISTFIDNNVRYWPRKPVAVFPERGASFTYRELLAEVNSFANALRSLGVSKGDRVAVYMPNMPETLISFLGTWRMGATAVPMNVALKDFEVKHLLKDSGASVVVTTSQGYEVLEHVMDEVPDLRHVIVVDGRAGTAIPWRELVGKSRPSGRAENCEQDCWAQLQYTSGTTGLPKGAMLTHCNWIAAFDAERWALGLTDRDVELYIYPMVHVGFSWALTALRYGATVVFMERYSMDRYLRYAAEYNVTILATMPPVMSDLVNGPGGVEEYLRTIRVAITGGAPTPQSTWEKWASRFRIPVLNAYGLSETIVVGSAPGTVPGWEHLSKGYRSVGAPIGYSEVKIVDPGDPEKELGTGEVGEIALRGPAIAKGYWKNEEATRESFMPDGWFLTGDMGFLDEDGVLYVTDRKKDMIITSGFKVYPAEVESILLRNPKIKEVAVFARYDERRGEVPVAAVVLKPGERATADEILEWAKQHMIGYKVPRDVIFMEELPKMSGWKVLRRALRERFGNFPLQENQGKDKKEENEQANTQVTGS
ncbi:MAG TPA: long-chain fatty acid--CoA ligase [Nitrososphaeria archaeon]|nr:long-chain fatty acid--CoA ligase [Nitrososphaeria archaeon]